MCMGALPARMSVCEQHVRGGQNKVSDPLELELQMVVSHPTEVLRIEFRTSGKVEVISTTETSLTPWGKK